ncbi:MAG: hypothetical protein JNM91_03410, partial [Flavobacteriales bacterium]|nr:hypothetical protein [Flavobacteriales bacterium]
AEAAAIETKRSVDAYVDTERGRLVYDREEWGAYNLSFKVWFRNVGKNPVIVRFFDALYQPRYEGVPLVAIMPGRLVSLHHVILPGEYFIAGVSKEEGCHPFTYKAIPKAVTEGFAKRAEMCADFTILYDTIPAKSFLLEQCCFYGPVNPTPWINVLAPHESEVSSGYLEEAREKRKNNKDPY